MATKTDDIVADLENDCLSEVQSIPEYDEVVGSRIRKYFSRSELVDSLLISLKQVRKSCDIPESLEDVTVEERPRIIPLAASICLRKMVSDALSEDINAWQKKVLGEVVSDRKKTAEWFEKLASDYEGMAR
jgi:hypothetical protein